ncbi:MAG: DNA-3-methyladenine glycosylase I, partial [Bacteroidetes bacterium]|nr:DNA-3-methyladenine glycosylase I [Bacteroidota bacterium]
SAKGLNSHIHAFTVPFNSCPKCQRSARDHFSRTKQKANTIVKRGWKFVGPPTAYTLMQAMGLVNDHMEGCAIREIVEHQRSRFSLPLS